MLFRIFPSSPGAGHAEPGGALYVARDRQGSSRHDNPDHYGALYCARQPESAVAEHLQRFRGQEITDSDLVRADGRRYVLAAIDETRLGPLADLDDPRELVRRNLRPSSVATLDRATTQGIALALFGEDFPGFAWWSTLEASWTNVTLFSERALSFLTVAEEPEPLAVGAAIVRRVADLLGVSIEEGASR